MVSKEHPSSGPTSSPPSSLPQKGMALLACSSLSFSLMGIIVHALPLSFWMLACARGVVTIAILLPWMLYQKIPLWGAHRGWLLMRSLAGSVSLLCFFYALHTLSLADATLLTYTNPLWVALLAPLLLKETFRKERLGTVLVGLLGLVLILGPSGNFLHLGGLAGAFSGVTSALAYISVRRLRGDHPFTVVLHFAVVSALISLPGAILSPRLPEGVEWAGLFGIGFFAFLGQWLMTSGYRLVEASVGSVVNLLTPLLAQLFSVLLFKEPLGGWQIVGGVLVLSAGVYLSRKESLRIKQDQLALGAPKR